MSTDQLAGGGRGGARWAGWPRVRWRRPGGIRNGGLLLALVAAAALMALVDQPVGPGQGRPLPGSTQHLPPPVGIAQAPPGAPPPSTGEVADGERPAAAARAHPSRLHPRPDRPGSPSGRAESALTPSGGRAGSGGSGSGGTGSGGTAPPSPPPVTTAPVQASASVRVPSVGARATPPTVAGRSPRAVEVETPEVSVDLPLSVPPVTLLGG